MELSYLKIFFEVARAGKFSEVAKKLHISQSALSRSVNLLEEDVGVKLFDRSKTGASLTPKGLEVFKIAEELFSLEKQIENICKNSDTNCSGALSFAASDHIINYLLPDLIHTFRRKYPGVIPCIRSGSPDDLIRHLQNTDAEFALMFAKVNAPNIEYKKISEQKMALVCNPQIWNECKLNSTDKTIKKIIKQYGYISSIGAILDKRLSKVVQEVFGEVPKFGLEVDSQESQKRMCIKGEGIAYLAQFMVQEEIKNGTLFEIPNNYIHDFNLWIARPKGKFLSASSRAFIEHISNNINN